MLPISLIHTEESPPQSNRSWKSETEGLLVLFARGQDMECFTVDPVTFDLGSALCATYLHCDLIWVLRKHQSINTLFVTKYEFENCQSITFPWLNVDGGHTFWHWEPRNRLCSSSIDLVPIQFHIVRGAHCRKVEAWLPAGRCMSDCQIVRLSIPELTNVSLSPRLPDVTIVSPKHLCQRKIKQQLNSKKKGS